MTKRGGRFLKNTRRGMTAELTPQGPAELADDSDVLGISLDAPVGPSQLLGGVTETVTGTATVRLADGLRGRGEHPRCVRRAGGQKNARLKLEHFGHDVGVAIIDSGIAPTPDVAPAYHCLLRLH